MTQLDRRTSSFQAAPDGSPRVRRDGASWPCTFLISALCAFQKGGSVEVHTNLVPCGILVTDAEHRITHANARLLGWLGADLADVKGRDLTAVLSTGRADAEPFDWLRHEDGPALPVLRESVRVADGRLIALFDATTQHAYQEELHRSHRLAERTRNRLELVIEAAIAFARATTEAQFAEVLATTVSSAYGADAAAVFLRNDADRFEHIAGTNPFEQHPKVNLLVSRAVDLRTVITVSSAEDADALDPMLGAAFHDAGMQALLTAPLLRDGVPIGLFACFFRNRRPFDAEAAPLAEALAGQAAQVAITLRLQRQLMHAATHDEVTGLPNRRFLEAQILGYSTRAATLIAALFIDLDGFKCVNDELGHTAGDELLRQVGARLRSVTRDRDLVARYGGDEFVVVCEVRDTATARELGQRLQEAIEPPYEGLPAHVHVGASVGVSVANAGDAHVGDRLIRAADQAMYAAKTAGGNQIMELILLD
ncbi:diguanylate cyclase domain-containing protein [Agromyces aerolatus]|uniref:diguanylate cyclase domain-containing protein n=1 Tax=Agromyces sp. LY-1074 TaxID=3074080 RepID=UPI002855D2E6|nr:MULTISPECIES: diguanylate cyclase [unclassified Agromyces]MDR5698945.1 diguanylate cyclase [Agromyces sp. LY-1074]MDR5705277.1 diguanylate cyclase [Agromyces sp. LY-1358]